MHHSHQFRAAAATSKSNTCIYLEPTHPIHNHHKHDRLHCDVYNLNTSLQYQKQAVGGQRWPGVVILCGRISADNRLHGAQIAAVFGCNMIHTQRA